MAQKKDMEEKPKRARKSKVKSNALPVEQINELMFIHNKNDPQTGVQAVSGIDEKGKVQTVPADERNENSFLNSKRTPVSSKTLSRTSGANSRNRHISGSYA